MTVKFYVGAMAAAALVAGPVAAQMQAMPIPIGGQRTVPVPQTAAARGDTPEEIAKDAQRDLKDTRFYNKPGATRVQYDADWQQCRLIARGSRTPSGSIPYYYNPAMVSPLAAGIGGGLGGLIAGAIVQGQQRRENRRQCLLIRGWRLVEVPTADAARVSAMTGADRSAYFNTLVGARHVNGAVTERTRFSLAPDANLHLDAPLANPGAVFAGKKVDPAQPIALAASEGVVVLAYRRAEPATMGRSGSVSLLRYDVEHRDVMFRPKDWKKTGDMTVYSALAASHDKKTPYEVQVVRVTAGDYVINAAGVGPAVATSTNCFGAPVLHVGAGEVVYLGDFHPYMNAALSDGSKVSELARSMHLEDARATLATRQPALAARLKPAVMRNGATYACSGVTMTRTDFDGLEMLPPAANATIAVAPVTD